MDKKATILVVDDELGVLQSLNMVLKDDYHILLAKTGREAIDIFEQKHKLAKEELKDLKVKLKILEDQSIIEQEVECKESLEEVKKKIKQNEELQKSIKDLNLKLKEEIKPVVRDLSVWADIASRQNTINSLEFSCQCKHQEGCSFDKKIREIRSIIKKEQKGLPTKEDLNQKYDTYKLKVDENNKKWQKAVSCGLELSKDLGAAMAQYQSKKASAEEYEALKANYEAYDYFMRAMSKDGIVRQIISNNLGVINSEIAKILSYGVGFSVFLESNEDGKAIDIFFKHEKSPNRYIELCSGMEKTLAEIAIRAALVNVTTLPRSNIFVLDESFGALDAEYMAGLTRILEYLKTLFETVVIITHEESLKDFVDYIIEVERDESGYSKLS